MVTMHVIKRYGPDGTWGTLSVEGNTRVYTTKRSRKQHLLRMMKGWGIERIVIDDLKRMACSKVRIKIRGEGVIEVERKDYERYGVTMKFPPFESQVFLPERHFTWL